MREGRQIAGSGDAWVSRHADDLLADRRQPALPNEFLESCAMWLDSKSNIEFLNCAIGDLTDLEIGNFSGVTREIPDRQGTNDKGSRLEGIADILRALAMQGRARISHPSRERWRGARVRTLLTASPSKGGFAPVALRS